MPIIGSRDTGGTQAVVHDFYLTAPRYNDENTEVVYMSGSSGLLGTGYIYLYTLAGTNPTARLHIYTHHTPTGGPDDYGTSTLVVSSNTVTIPADTSWAWYSFTFPPTLLEIGEYYCITASIDTNGTTVSWKPGFTTPVGRIRYAGSNHTAPSDLSSFTIIANAQAFAIYAEYTANSDVVSVVSNSWIGDNPVFPHTFTYAAVGTVTKDIVTNYDAFDIQLKHICDHNLSDIQYTLTTCPRCLGTGYYYDIRFNEAGKPLEVSLVDKLVQTLEKFVLTENNDFHPEVAINVQQWLGKSSISEIKAIIKFELSKSLMILMSTQRGVLSLSNESQIASIDSIEVFEDINNADRLDYAVTITTVAGSSRELTGTVVLNE